MHSPTRAGAALLLLALAALLRAQPPAAPPPSGPTTGPSGPSTGPSSPGSAPSTGPGVTRPYGEPPAPTEVGGKSLGQWKQDLTSADSYVRAKAIQSVVHFGPAAADAVPLLTQRCQDRDVSPRTKAVIALRMVRAADKDRPKAVEALSQRLWTGTQYGEAQAIVRYEAARSLLFYAALDPTLMRPVLAAVAKGAEDPTCCEARHVCVQVVRIGGRDKNGPDPRATNALLKAMHDPTADVRLEAILGLGSMGRPTDPALLGKVVNSLQQVLYSRAPRTHLMWAHVGLLAMDDKLADSALKALVRYLDDPDMKVRAEAAHVLGAVGPQAKKYVPALLKHLSDKEPVAISVCAALVGIKDTSPAVLQGLVKQLERKEPGVVAAACLSLGELGVSNRQMLDALQAAADRPGLDKDLKAIIQGTLDHFSKPAKPKAAP
jgi:HEAT repeat protein